MRFLLTCLIALSLVAGAANAQLVLTGVFDGPLSGGVPKFVELYTCSPIDDLSLYGIGSANNGGGTDGVEFTFPADAVAAGTTIYVATAEAGFLAYFGFSPTYVNGTAPNINGDDAIELFYLGGDEPEVIDVFGEITWSGLPGDMPWYHLDGWVKRVTMTGPEGDVFVLANWTFSGVDATDGCTTNDTCESVYPLGGFECDPVVQTEASTLGAVKNIFR